ncbi:MAG: hypothetical protein WBM69_08780 [Desulfobacterales bacterium]
MLKIILSALVLVFSINGHASAAPDDAFEIESAGRYQMADGVSIELAKKIALFSARRQAVDLAGRYLSRQSLIVAYELNRDEIYSLAAREIETKILEEKRQTVGKILTFTVRIRARVQPSDFVKAEMEDARQKKSEAKELFSEEMEQPVSDEIDPGKDISKVYRLLREKKWRIAMIYMNHLEKKYPNWAEIQMAKALVYYIFHEPVFMEKALNDACRLGNNTACDDVKNIKKVHKYDFGISAAE